MLRFVLYDLTLFGPGDDVERARKALCWLMESLVQRNIDYLKVNPDTPRLYKSGVKYQVPLQFDGECEEVKILRSALGSTAKNDSRVANVLDLVQAVLGGERFRDIGRIIENGGGDCLPVETLVETPWGHRPIGDLVAGDIVTSHLGYERDHRTIVTKVWPRSTKPTITLFLSDGSKTVASPEHRVYAAQPGMSPQFWEVENLVEGAEIGVWRDAAIKFLKIAVKEPSAPRECVDISTAARSFVLSESRAIVHNCDNLATWRVAELRQSGIEARPFMTHRMRLDGGTTYHALVLWPPINEAGRVGNKAPDHLWTSEDPSLLLGMGGAERAEERAEEIRKNKERCELLSRRGKPQSQWRALDSDSEENVEDDIYGELDRILMRKLGGRG